MTKHNIQYYVKNLFREKSDSCALCRFLQYSSGASKTISDFCSMKNSYKFKYGTICKEFQRYDDAKETD